MPSMLWTSFPLKSRFAGPETASSVIAKCVFGNCAAIVARSPAMRYPAAMTMFDGLRTAVVRFGMYSFELLDWSGKTWIFRTFFARFSPASWDWLKLLSLNRPTSLTRAARNVAFAAVGLALPLPTRNTASAVNAMSAARTPAANRFVLKKALLLLLSRWSIRGSGMLTPGDPHVY